MQLSISHIIAPFAPYILPILQVFGGLCISALLLLLVIKSIARQLITKNNRGGILLEITLPKQKHQSDTPNEKVSHEKTKSSVAEQMYAELHSLNLHGIRKVFLSNPSISFEIFMTSDVIRFYCFCPKNLRSFVENTIYATYPESNVQEVTAYAIPKGVTTAGGNIKVNGPEYAPIRTYDTMVVDPLNVLLNGVSHLQKDEILVMQTIISPTNDAWRSRASSFLSTMKEDLISQKENGLDKTKTNVIESLTGQNADPKTQDMKALDRELYDDVERKMSRPAFQTTIRILAMSPSKENAATILKNFAQSLAIFDEPPLTTFLLHRVHLFYRNFLHDFFLRLPSLLDVPFHRVHFLANTIELATLFHFPGEEIEASHVNWLDTKSAPAPTDIPTSGIVLGINNYHGTQSTVHMNPEDRKRHMYIVGQTGTGKTEFLKHLILQDIIAGNGVCFIDPHGDAAEDILKKIPANRIKDTIYWNPADTNFPMGLNIMEANTNEEKNKVINSFIAMLYKMYDPSHVGIMGPLIERAIRNVMLTAMEEKGSTLVEVLRLLTSPAYAKTKIPLIKDKLVKTYWTEELAHTTEFHKSETLGYFVSKFDRFVTDNLIRNIIGQPVSSFDFKEIMNAKKILIVNLSKGKLGEENSKFLGLLLIPKILLAAMSRADIPEEKRNEFYLYVDEFQNFATSDFSEILSESRKYGLSLTIAHQYISQIEEDIRGAIIGNVGTICAFRVGADDAKYLLPQFQPTLNEYDLTNNGIGNIYTKLLIQGKPSMPFSIALDWQTTMQVQKDQKIMDLISSIAKLKYGMPKDIVETEINVRAGL